MPRIRQLIADAIWPEGRERRDTAERLANTDSLTGLANIVALQKALPIAEADHLARVLVLDVDDFKVVNDTYGYAVGDDALKTFADGLTAMCPLFGARPFRRNDKTGDEFVVICPSHLAEAARTVFEGLRWHHLGSVTQMTCGLGETAELADMDMLCRKRRKGCGR